MNVLPLEDRGGNSVAETERYDAGRGVHKLTATARQDACRSVSQRTPPATLHSAEGASRWKWLVPFSFATSSSAAADARACAVLGPGNPPSSEAQDGRDSFGSQAFCTAVC